MTEAELVRAVLLALGSRPDLRVWRNNVGLARDPVSGRCVRFGLLGSADLLGLLRGGRFLAVELKSERGRQTEQQRAFQRMVESLGGLYVLGRSTEEIVEAIERALA